ncbi:MAG: DUF1724 domain-containing protein [Candidatus Bathyarchaeota archaeon]|nr:DUF1724 domain-containing protein [Candidatus Bathyarchaeota archaeon]
MFEVSNEDRVRILEELRVEPTSYSGLSRKLGITTQEISRHLSRLNEIGLTTRRPNGLPVLTPFGEVSLRQLRATQFTTKYKDYFRSHTVAGLPALFVARMGELKGCTVVDNVMVAIHNVEKILREAEEYLCNLNLPYISSAFPYIREAFDRGVFSRFLHGETLQLPPEMQDDRDEVFEKDTIDRLKMQGTYHERQLDVELIIYMSEKEVALLSFPEEDRGFDFKGFTSTDPAAHQWCLDVFEYYWEKGVKA